MGFLKKITKPISKVLDKIIPNEVKPFLPYAAAVAPFMAPAGIMGTSMLQRALISGGLNLGAQLAQEGSEGDFNPLSVLLAGGTGALTAPNAAASLRANTFASKMGDSTATRNLFQKGVDFGLEGLAKGAQGLQGFSSTLKDPFSGTLTDFAKAASLPTIQGTGDLAYASANRDMKAYEKAMAEFNRLQEEGSINNYNDYYTNILKYMDLAGFTAEEAEDAAERVLSQINFANGGRVSYLGGGPIYPRIDGLSSGVSEAEQTLQEINQRLQSAESALGSGGGTLATLASANPNNLLPGTTVPIGGTFNGMPLRGPRPLELAGPEVTAQQPAFGSMEEAYSSFQDKAKKAREEGMLGRVVLPGEMSFEDFSNNINLNTGFFGMHGAGGVPAGGNNMQPSQFSQLPLNPMMGQSGIQKIFANGGRVGYLGGGNVATPPGMEMDLRVGGFIPIGQAERADDVLARVSKNEFVMTADAVRGMGNGDPRAGAQKMYQLMNNLEARV